MSFPFWVSEMADGFWRLAGGQEDPPRDFRMSIACAVPLTVVVLPRLRVSTVDRWLKRNGIDCSIEVEDRVLRAVLVARYGHGIIFLEGGDPPDEHRYSLAHELAHFLRHYWYPRQELVAQLGPRIADVLDGERLPTREERIHALLARNRIGYFVHLMSRANKDSPNNVSILRAEQEADLLAYELLAPAADVIKAVTSVPAAERRIASVDLLTTTYGLPTAVAQRYADVLLPRQAPSNSLLHRLGFGNVELSTPTLEVREKRADRKVDTIE